MDFGALPPEVNSARMYAGPGSAPLLAAAANWSAMATELQYTATSYASVIADLADSAWQGPSAATMSAAAAPYAAWLKATAVGAEETALKATAAAGAYEAAYAATVPPPVIAANRTLLGTLVATNFLGQNAPAIAATEAQYGEMWAQDAAAMYAYAGSSATASQLEPFNTPPETTNGSGQVSQSAAASSAESSLSELLNKIPNALQSLITNPLTPTQIVDDYQAIIKTVTGVISTANGPYGINLASSARSIYQMAISIPSVANGLGNLTSTLSPKPIVGALSPLLASPLLSGSHAVPAAVSGAVGRAGLIGSLSVPSTWATAVPAVKTATVALQASVLEAAPALAVNGEGMLAGQMALSSLAGRAIGTPIRQAAGATATRAISAITHVTNNPTAPDIATTATVIVIPPIAK
ncbi:PPE family protein [[Mycobacterium] holstebronense]|uniref:PPE family protein n=1 Tax=[Mycobacterium] holstebronense TaxID=3064288 RepID=A0ABM9LTJ8_9MYCO|nr:PPE family protein [Mycolicibacter sp. MU0102]CAJ1504521.1 PPE family protein [Mycolicibacter sp. MU0102]